MEVRLTDLGAQEQLDAAVKQRADEKYGFGVNFQDVSESVDALQRAIVVFSERSDADSMALLQRQSKTETAMHRVRLQFSKSRDGGKGTSCSRIFLLSSGPLERFLPSRG